MYTTDPKIQEATVTVQTRPTDEYKHRRKVIITIPASFDFDDRNSTSAYYCAWNRGKNLPECSPYCATPIVQPLRLWRAVKTTFVCMSWCLLPVKKRLSSPSLVKLVTTSTASCKILLKFLGMVSILILSKFKWQCHLKNLRLNLRFFYIIFFLHSFFI